MGNILITGASSGIGKATAEYLVKQGNSVLLVARNAENLARLQRELGEQAKIFPYDLSDLENIGEIFAYCKEINFVLDGLVYCAGMTDNGPLRQLDYTRILKVMNINCIAFLEMARFAIKRGYAADRLSIVAMSSLASKTCYGGTLAYSMSKAALNVACKVLSKETTRRGIRVNTIMPGYVKTPMTESLTEEDIKQEQPLGFIDPCEIAHVIGYLLSEESRHITGACIPVSAGMNF